MNDQKSWQKIVGILVVLGAVAGVGYYIYTDSISTVIEDDENILADTDDIEILDIIDPDTGESIKDKVAITPIEDDTTEGQYVVPAPNLNRPITFFIELPQELQDIYKNRIEKITQELVLNSANLSSWIDLGVQRKGIGDYEGAREIWEYANIISPQNNVSFFNLGDLYHFYLKDFKEAEKNLLLSKENNPTYIPVYRALFDLYTFSYKQETSSAEDVLKEGLENNPNELDLLVLLAGHYKKAGNVSEARTYYEQALKEAEKSENTSMVSLITEELGNL